jgi:hypothetical protein
MGLVFVGNQQLCHTCILIQDPDRVKQHAVYPALNARIKYCSS